MPDERQSNVLIAYWQAIEAMVHGYACEAHFDTLVYAVNLAVLLAEDDCGEQDADILGDAMAGIRRTKERYLTTGKFGLDGDALMAVRAAYGLHEAQVRSATLGQLSASIEEMHRRIESTKETA